MNKLGLHENLNRLHLTQQHNSNAEFMKQFQTPKEITDEYNKIINKQSNLSKSQREYIVYLYTTKQAINVNVDN